MTNKHELKMKQLQKYKIMDKTKQNKICKTKKQTNTKQWILRRSKNFLRNAERNTVTVVVRRQWIHVWNSIKRK